MEHFDPNDILISAVQKLDEMIIAYEVYSDDFYVTPLTFINSSFEAFGFDDIHSCKDIVEHIEAKSETCEVEGYKEYIQKAKDVFSIPFPVDTTKHIYLPLSSKGHLGSFILFINDLPDKHIRFFMFLQIEQKAIKIESLFFDSFKDNLTGLFNFNTFQKHAGKNLHTMYLGLFDLNKFKIINDKYGHHVGDEVISVIGNLLISLSSKNEIYYHRSGDEFIFISFVDKQEYIIKLIEKISEGLARIGLIDEDVTAAFGAAEIIHPKADNEEITFDDTDKLIYADYAMYKAKASNQRYVILTNKEVLQLEKEGDISSKVAALRASIGR